MKIMREEEGSQEVRDLEAQQQSFNRGRNDNWESLHVRTKYPLDLVTGPLRPGFSGLGTEWKVKK